MSEYLNSIKRGVASVIEGMSITLRHFSKAYKWRQETALIDDDDYFNKLNEGLVTIQYPSEAIPTPDFSRNRLHNNAEDCIACNQCANACPVNCITIESFKATPDDLEELGTTSDGSKKKLWLARFDIDMAKCMYCGLCTYPCPTECLTMTPVHDFAEVDRSNFIYHFGVLTKEKEKEKREKLAKYEEEEKARKAAAPASGARPSPLAAKKAAASAETASSAPSAETQSSDTQPAKKLPPMMAAKLAAKKAGAEGSTTSAPEAKAETSAPAAPSTEAESTAQPAKKLPPMVAAKLAAKKAGAEGSTASAPEAKAETSAPAAPSTEAESTAQPAKKLPPMVAAKLAAKKAAEEAAKKQTESGE